MASCIGYLTEHACVVYVPLLYLRRDKCVLQLRKAERRNEQLQNDCDDLQLTASRLTDRSNDDRRKIRQLEEELATAKDVSIRLHDECERLQQECFANRQKITVDKVSL